MTPWKRLKKTWKGSLMWPRTQLIRWMLYLGGTMMWLQIGCDSQFEGYDTEPQDETIVQASLTPLDFMQTKKTRHQPVRFCRQCHAGGGSFRARRFIKPIPELCHDCHEDSRKSNPYVHGPVGVGACLFCHRPHISSYEHLLKTTQPRLCTRCHDKTNYPLSEMHHEVSDQLCTDCHDPHGSTHPLFLKQ